MSDSDRSRSPTGPISLVVEYASADEMVADFTQNLSGGGTFVQTDRDLDVGQEVTLILSFPGLVQPIKIPGCVRWTRGGQGPARGAGIEFRDSAEIVEEVENVMARVASGDPGMVRKVLKVLVVEDNPHVARLIREGLAGGTRRAFGSNVQFEFDNAANGRDALRRLELGGIDLLVIDVYLPILDGPAVIEAARASEQLRGLPIIAVSAGGTSARDAALAAGADFFLEKPMRLRQIIDSMRALMDLDNR